MNETQKGEGETQKGWRERLLKLHYEPEHESGELCWCEPKSFGRNGVQHIEHQEQRHLIPAFIEELLAAQETAFKERVREELKKLEVENFDGIELASPAAREVIIENRAVNRTLREVLTRIERLLK